MLNNGTKVIAICSADISVDYNDRYYKSFIHLAEEYNCKLLFFNAFSSLFRQTKHDAGEGYIYQLINYDLLDGIIMLSESIKDDSIRQNIVEQAKIRNIPVVAIEHSMEGCYNINYDYDSTIRHVIEHLITDHHFTRINFIAGMKNNEFSDGRLNVYKQVLTEHNIPIEEERIGYGNFWFVPTKAAIDQFLQSDLPFPEAIVCANDAMAIAAIRYLSDAGYRVPEDVAVTGFDGIEEAIEHIPTITTVEYDFSATAKHAFGIIFDVLAGKEREKQSYIASTIRIGGSCGCKTTDHHAYNHLIRVLHDRLDVSHLFNEKQIFMAADLTDNESFQGIFSNLMNYTDVFYSKRFWLCIVDDYLNEEEELSDILEESTYKAHRSYSGKMDMMLGQVDGEWQGLIDFNTEVLLPNLEKILEDSYMHNLMFLPLHVLDHTIGYVALVYDYDLMNMGHLYQFLMNISNALETTKNAQRQQNIISSLENKYIHDPMTGLFNRRGFYQRIEPLFEQCTQNQEKIMVVSADLNGLKYINDTYGHSDGDIAISTVGKALAQTMSFDATCARFGGDEFVAAAVVRGPGQEDAFRRAMHEFLFQFNTTSGKPYEVSTSIGIASAIPTSGVTLEDFIKQADEQMYEEKSKHHLRRKD